MDTSFSQIDYTSLTVDVAEFDITIPTQRRLPILTEPDQSPVSPDAGGNTERLIRVDHRRVICVPAYQLTGWSHTHDGTWMRETAAERLYRAASLLPDRFGLAVFDAWRPLELQREIYDCVYADASIPAGFVNVPSQDPSTPPPHSTGGVADVTLSIDGVAVALGTPFDDFSNDAWTAAFEDRPGPVRDGRRLLYWAMRDAGFVVLDQEWWHYEYGTRRWSAITGETAIYGPADA